MDGGRLSYEYDAAHRLTAISNSLGERTEYTHDVMGNVTKSDIKDGGGAIIATQSAAFDGLGRIMQQIGAASQITAFGYDPNDNLMSITDPLNEQTLYAFDALDRLIKEVDALSGEVDQGYDDQDNLVSLEDQRDLATTFVRNGFGEVIQEASPDRGAMVYTYDAAGNVTEMTDGRGVVTQYAYDLADNLTQITYPSGRIVDYGRDSLGRVSAVTTKENSGASSDNIATALAYRAFGGLAGLTFGNGLDLAIAHDQDGRPTSVVTTDAGTDVHDLAFAYDLASQVTGIADGVDAAKSENFAYDALGRLTDATGGYDDIDYAYDAAHNRTSRTWTEGGSTVVEALTLASASNQVTQVGDGTDTRTFLYDAAGNVTSDTRYDGTAFAYVYDQRGRLAELKRNAVTEATYLVDARHLRVAKLSSVDSVHFLYDQDGHLLAEADATTGQTLREYLWLGDQPLSVVTDVDTASPRTHFIHTDHLGTPELITQGDKTVAWNPTLTPFGELASVAGTLGFDLRLPGQYADAESDLHQNWHRDYDPALGRYMQADPIGLAGGTNLYGYAHANPLGYVDPTGEIAPWIVAAGIGAGSGTLIDLGLQLVENGWNFACIDYSSLATAAIAGAGLSGLGPTGFLLGRGGKRAAEAGYRQAPGLANRGNTRFGWSFNGNTRREALSFRRGSRHYDIPGTSIRPGAKPARDGVLSGLVGGLGNRLARGSCGCDS